MVSTANHYPIIPFDQRGRKPQHPSVPKSSHSPKIKSSNLPNPFLPFSDLSQNKKAKKQQKTTKKQDRTRHPRTSSDPFPNSLQTSKEKNKKEIPKTPSDQIQNSFSNQNKPRPATSPLNRLFPPPSTHHPSPLSLATTSLAVTIVFEDEDELQSVLLSAKVKATKRTHSRLSPDVDCGKHGAVELSLFSSTFCYVVEGECSSQYIDFGSRFSWKLQLL